LEGRLLSSQSEQSEKFSKSSDWLEKKSALQKSHFCSDHVNRLNIDAFTIGRRTNDVTLDEKYLIYINTLKSLFKHHQWRIKETRLTELKLLAPPCQSLAAGNLT